MKINIEDIKEKGFFDISIDKSVDLIKEINNLKKEKNAVILGHYYQTEEIQDISDFIGDSLQLSQEAAKTNADIIVFAGVHFMAETAKILSPSKKVLVPDIKAGCSLADSVPAVKFKKFIDKHPDHVVISYINTTAEIKAMTDIICTSSNAVQIVNSLPKDQKIIFAPDRNLGNYINSITGRNMVVWDGACHVHEKFSVEKIIDLKNAHPDAKILAHPECKKPVLLLADFIGSTAAILKFSSQDDTKKYIIATESGIIHQMQKKNPQKIFIPAPPNDSTCACNDCNFMKLNTLKKLYICMKYEVPEIILDKELIEKAVIPIKRMLELSGK
ncbi:MAG: quinolinate synthase [Bacteroidetes bacterium RIFOXYB2_FULL_35_7]|nr:MAG: quinolinate synthase [Bacteroidetes bacterium GWF2_35_48]OFY96285.1 MAG: quinolinate synthase [Bacteroidetes bacterium RIFOXYC12_FULL_35_7]OFY97480.1 MAG: quinolinate synthase [Bacteroidetes bacterium RIFOXYB2_FULL_35_7]HBX51025.1 quinolinate synthase [Bacteroidales bacterium]